MINYSISTKPYNRTKDGNKVPMKWIEKSGNLEKFKQDILHGFAFCHTFNVFGCFSTRDKKQANFKSADFIILDMDDMELDYEEFIKRISSNCDLIPSFVYTTASNGVDKHNTGQSNVYRYRVIYCLDEPITSVGDYKACVLGIKNEIGNIIGDMNVMNDTTDGDAAHFFAGNCYASCWTSSNTLKLSDLRIKFDLKGNNTCSGKIVKTKQKKTTEAKKMPLMDLLDEDLRNDLREMKYRDLLMKYIQIYPIIEHTDFELDPNALITYVPDDYMEIRRKGEWIINHNGNKQYVVVKCKNGEGRRSCIFYRMVKKAQIKRDITFSHLFVNALYELVWFIDNTDKEDRITIADLLNITNDAMNNRDKYTFTDKQPKFKVNKQIASEIGMTARQVVLYESNIQRQNYRRDLFDFIDTIYEPNATDKRNIELLEDCGIYVSRDTLKRYKRERVKMVQAIYKEKEKSNINGLHQNDPMTRLTKKEKEIARYYDSNLTVDANIKLLAANGIKVGEATIKRYKKKLRDMKTNKAATSDNTTTVEEHPTTNKITAKIEEKMNKAKTNKTATSAQETVTKMILPFGLDIALYTKKCAFYEEHLQPISTNKHIA